LPGADGAIAPADVAGLRAWRPGWSRPCLRLDRAKRAGVGSSWIGVRSDLAFPEQAVTLVHELRHLDQVARGFARSLDPACSEAVRLVCAHEANALAVTTLYAVAATRRRGTR
jgi:hypothetical protein